MPTSVFVWSFVLFGVILAAFVIVSLVRRRYFRAENFPKEGFTISDLRQMREAGQMSAEEFEKARAALVGKNMNQTAGGTSSDKLRQ